MGGDLPQGYLRAMEVGGTSPPGPASAVSGEEGVGAGRGESSGRRRVLPLQELTLDWLGLLSWRWWDPLPAFDAKRGKFLGLDTLCQVSAIAALSGWSLLG